MYLQKTICVSCPQCGSNYPEPKFINVGSLVKGDIPLINTGNSENDIKIYLATISALNEMLKDI